jgi:hypothetical protein
VPADHATLPGNARSTKRQDATGAEVGNWLQVLQAVFRSSWIEKTGERTGIGI